MSVTMKQVAAEVGVSVPAVSQALHGTGGNTRISEEMRTRIIQTAAQIGYRPNSMARGTRTGRTQSVALILGVDPERSHLPPVMHQAMCSRLATLGMHLVLSHMTDADLTSEKTMPRILNELVVDGLLVNYTHGSPKRLGDLIDRYGIPAVWLNHKREFDCVYPDDYGGGQLAAAHLLGLGHRRIAHVDFLHAEDGDHTSWHYSVDARFAGAAAAMRAAGLPVQRVLRTAATPLAHRQEAAHALLDGPGRPTALITYNPADAQMLMYVAAQRGLRVPEDLSLVSFSEQPELALGTPLSIVGIPAADVSEIGVDMLVQRIGAATTAGKAVCVPCEDVCGATTARIA